MTIQKPSDRRTKTSIASPERERVMEQIKQDVPDLMRQGRESKRKELARRAALKAGFMVPLEDVMPFLRSIRELNRYRLEDIQQVTGIGHPNLSRLEREKGNPTLETINRIAAAMGKRVMITFEDLPAPNPAD